MTRKLFVYSDGGARGNPGPAAIGVLLCDPEGHKLKDHKETIGDTTNNVAEYTAVLVGLELAAAMGAVEIEYYVDSQLVAKQLSGEYKIKTPHIRELYDRVQTQRGKFSKVRFIQVPRTHEKIKYVDRLVNRALDRKD